jgi:hypothetical protein
LDGRDTDHYGVADYVIHLVAFEHGLREGHRHTRLRRRRTRRADLQTHTVPVRAVHDRLELGAASVEDTDTVADRESKHARQVFGFIDWEENSIAGDTCRRREEPREGHASAL